jgi:hypothetical protein
MAYRLEYNKNSGGWNAVPLSNGFNVAPSVTWGAVGTGSSGTTSCTPSYPTGISAATSRLYCVVTGRGNTANTVPTMPAGWTRIGGLEGGTGTWGVDTGTRRVDIFKKDTVAGNETGTVTVSLSGTTANTLRATIHRVEIPAGHSIVEELGTGADTTNATSYSATSSTNIDFLANDLLLIAVAQNIDTGTQSAQSITASNVTFGTRTNRASTAVTNGNDHRHIVDSVPISSVSGTPDVAPTYAYTISASGSGPTAFLRLRSVAPSEPEIYVAPSTYITAGGENTTAQLTAPSGKSSSTDFDAGRIWDDENDSDTVTITTDDYTELEWCLKFSSTASGTFQFRVTDGGAALTTYTQTPTITAAAGVTLAIANMAVAASLDALTLTQAHTLAGVGDMAVAVSEDNLVLVQQHQLAGVGDIAVAVSEETLTLEVVTQLALADVAVAVSEDNLTLTQQHTLTLAGMSAAVAEDSLALVQQHQLAGVGNLDTAVSEDNLTLTQQHTLTLENVAVAVAEDNVVLSTEAALSIASMASAVAEDGVTLTQVHFLATDNVAVAVSEDNVAINTEATLATADMAVAVAEDNLLLVQQHSLSLQPIAVAVTEDALTLVQLHVLTTADIAVAVSEENLTLSTEAYLSPADMSVAVAADNVTLTQQHVLAGVGNLDVAVAEEGLVLVQQHQLTTAGMSVAVAEDNLTLTAFVYLNMADIGVPVQAGNIDLVQQHSLTGVGNFAVGATFESLTLAVEATLVTADIAVTVSEQNLVLVQVHDLELGSVDVVVGVDAVVLTQVHNLTPADVLIGVEAGHVVLYLGPPIRDVHTATIVLPLRLTGVVEMRTLQAGAVVVNVTQTSDPIVLVRNE